MRKFEKARATLSKIVDRFETTKYSGFAQNRLKEIDRLENSEYLDQKSPRKYNRKILTPDF